MDVERDTGYYVTLTARAFKRVAETNLRRLGVGVAHMPVLAALASDGPLTQREIARRTHVEQPTAAALLQRMDSADLIKRTPDPRDGRSTLISVSTRGAEVFPEAMRLRSNAISSATAGLSAEEIEVLNDLLRRVLANLDTMIEGQGDR